MSTPSPSSPESRADGSAPAAEQPSRRGFLRWFLGTSLGALLASVAYPIVRFVSPPEVPEAATNQVDAGPVNDQELRERGFKIVRFGAEPVILIRVDEGEYRAFAATCTHLDCIVEYRQDDRKIWCNCHDGQYDLDGSVLAGPPPRPLERYTVHVVEGSGSAPASLVVEKA